MRSGGRSNGPEGDTKKRMVGLGLNAPEMKDNPGLDEYVVNEVNSNPVLTFDDDTLDAVVVTVSAQYLTRPIETFQQINRALKPGGIVVVTFSNRMFPTKAVRVWRAASDHERMDLVASYMDGAGNFERIRGGFVNTDESPPGDPIFSVVSNKSGGDPPPAES